MARLDVKVRLSDGVHDAELVKSGGKRSWVKLTNDKKVIKVRNHQLTIGTGELYGLDKPLLDSSGSPIGVVPPRKNPRQRAKLPHVPKNLHAGRRRG